jgi:hypothetical protein
MAAGQPFAWFRISSEDHWQSVDSLFLKSAKRSVRDALLFEP